MTAVDVDALDKLRAAATAGPWTADEYGLISGPDAPADVDHWIASGIAPTEQALIVAAVNALPGLLAEVRRGRALREAVEGLAEEYDDGPAWSQALYHGRGICDRLRAVVAATDGTP